MTTADSVYDSIHAVISSIRRFSEKDPFDYYIFSIYELVNELATFYKGIQVITNENTYRGTEWVKLPNSPRKPEEDNG